MSKLEIIWLCIGFFGQSLFFMRWLIQWLASERHNESRMPVAVGQAEFAKAEKQEEARQGEEQGKVLPPLAGRRVRHRICICGGRHGHAPGVVGSCWGCGEASRR